MRGATGKLVWYYQEVPGDDWDFDSIADLMLADLKINGKTRQVIMHAPKDGFFYVLDRRTGELLSADPWVTVNWASGVNLKTGRPVINPEARYGKDAVSVMPGPGGGHVWPPWSFNPTTGLVYIPSTIGGGDELCGGSEICARPTDIGPTGHAQFNMGLSFKMPPAGACQPAVRTPRPDNGPDVSSAGALVFAEDRPGGSREHSGGLGSGGAEGTLARIVGRLQPGRNAVGGEPGFCKREYAVAGVSRRQRRSAYWKSRPACRRSVRR